MTTYRKTLLRLIACCLPLIGLMGIPSVSVAEDPPLPPFTLTEYGALRDNTTGLEWGKHIDVNSHALFPVMHVSEFYYEWTQEIDENGNSVDVPPPGYDFSGPLVDGVREPHPDWRPPTIGELLLAIEHGLLDNLGSGLYDSLYDDFSYDAGLQAYGTPKGESYPLESVDWGKDIYWSLCVEKYRGLTQRYKFQFTEGPVGEELDYWMASGAGHHIAVRGKLADHSNCPGRHAEPFVPDPESSLTINDVTLKEGKSGNTTIFTFTVTRTGDLSEPVAVDFATEDSTATSIAGMADYEAQSGTLDFAIDESSRTVDVVVYGDSVKEPNEIFFVDLTEAVGTEITDSQGVGIIRNDDRK